MSIRNVVYHDSCSPEQLVGRLFFEWRRGRDDVTLRAYRFRFRPLNARLLWATPLVFSSDGDELYVSNELGRIEAWDVNDGTKRLEMVGHAGRINELDVSADGRVVASCGTDRTVRLWNVEKGVQLFRFPDLKQQVFSIALSPDGTRLAVASLEGVVRVHEAKPLSEIDSILGARRTTER